MMQYNVSTNILRDENKDLKYIVTKNTSDIFDTIIKNYNNNNRFQAIIGSYGTGKSTFLWAFEQNITGYNNFFKPASLAFPNIKKFQFIKLIGKYNSLAKSLANKFNLETEQTNIEDVVIDELDALINNNSKNNVITILIIDEFGKFLEYAVKNNPDKEIYFIQLLAELFNNPKHKAFALLSLHQNFTSYGQTLSIEQLKEWEKVKGRLKEIAFNEPIDQLLFFASERNVFKKVNSISKHKKILELIIKHNVSDKKQAIDKELAKKLFPIDYISAEILTKSLQRYGQNERSLFSFVDIEESNSLPWFYKQVQNGEIESSDVYNLNYVYDYLLDHYSFIIYSKYNPDFTDWIALKQALDQVDTRINDKQLIIDGRHLIKAIGLLNIFSHAGADLSKEFITSYATLALNINNAEYLIKQLEASKIITYKKYKSRFVFVSWTDLNIDVELLNAAQKIEEVTNVAERITALDLLHPILVKSEYYKTGTPRFFEYRFTKEPIYSLPNECDAILNYVFSEDKINITKHKLPIIHVLFTNANRVKELFFNIDKAKKVIEENIEDRAARIELEERIYIYLQEIKEILLDNIYDANNAEWFFNGTKTLVNNRVDINKLFNRSLSEYYKQSPILKNELINRSKISTPISLARKKLIKALINNQEDKDLGFQEKSFPPEKMIYLTLIKKIGLHRYNEATNSYEFSNPDFTIEDKIVNSYKTLWDTSVDFLDSSKHEKHNLKSLIDIFKNEPLKLKQGFIDFWIPIFLIVKKDDYALFNEDGYIPNINEAVFDIIFKSPQKFSIKAFDIGGVKLEVFKKYRKIIHQKETDLPSEKEFINTIKPFILFVRGLPEYTIKTKNLSEYSQNLREAIIRATDPEKAFFEDFPKALNYTEAIEENNANLLEGFVERLEASITELRSAYDNLLNRFEEKIKEVLNIKSGDFKSYSQTLAKRLKSIDPLLLNNKLRNFYRKCTIIPNERKTYLEGIAFVLLGKPLNKIDDKEETILHLDFEANYKRLLELIDIHKLKDEFKTDKVVGIRLINEDGNETKHQVIIPSEQKVNLENTIKELENSFNGIDKDLKKAVLIELLKKEVNNG